MFLVHTANTMPFRKTAFVPAASGHNHFLKVIFFWNALFFFVLSNLDNLDNLIDSIELHDLLIMI